ncbi:MAG TPA: M15 family metallopeptidase [Steroidobacteraceae bacterium]|nr:M15 family metallopeptidase [Steroidobacteraceae bacterium]
MVGPFLAMRAAAAQEGIDLVPFSSFRDFDRQLAIWNGKARGERELRDETGRLLDAASLDEDGRVAAILHWSALPGASRHHWGSDLDVMDAAAMPPGYRLQVVPEEYASGGVFGRLDAWLAEHAARFGFYRPYTTWRGGVQPEPWHLSHAAVAQAAMEQFSLEVLRGALDAAAIDARGAVEKRLPEILERYVRNVDAPPALALSAPRVTRPA